MNSLILVGLLAALPAVILLLIRSNAAVVFFGLCAGSVLANQLSGEAALMTSTIIKDGDLNNTIVSVGLTVLPALMSAFILRGSVKPSKMLFNLIPAAAVGALGVILIVPLLTGSQQTSFTGNVLWDNLDQFQSVILIGGMVSSVLLLSLTQTRSKKDKKRKK